MGSAQLVTTRQEEIQIQLARDSAQDAAKTLMRTSWQAGAEDGDILLGLAEGLNDKFSVKYAFYRFLGAACNMFGPRYVMLLMLVSTVLVVTVLASKLVNVFSAAWKFASGFLNDGPMTQKEQDAQDVAPQMLGEIVFSLIPAPFGGIIGKLVSMFAAQLGTASPSAGPSAASPAPSAVATALPLIGAALGQPALGNVAGQVAQQGIGTTLKNIGVNLLGSVAQKVIGGLFGDTDERDESSIHDAIVNDEYDNLYDQGAKVGLTQAEVRQIVAQAIAAARQRTGR